MRLFIVFFVFTFSQVFAQQPQADFSVEGTACLKQVLSISNTSANANLFEWDFCANDFSTLKNFENIVQLTGISYGTGFKLVEDNGQWTGFALGTYSDKLFRLDFGNSPLNVPTVLDLGDALNILLFPQGIELVKQNGSWFGFVTNNDNSAGITLLSFGASLTNMPSSRNLGGFGATGRIWDTKIVMDGLDFILVFAERNSNNLIRVNFRDSFDNATSGFVYTSTLVGPNIINGLDVVWTGSTWKVVVVSNGTNQIYQFDFGSDLSGSYTLDGAYPSIVNSPYRIDILKEANDYFLTVSGEAGEVRIFNFHDLDPAHAPVSMPYTTLDNMVGIDAIRFEGKSLLFGVGTSSNLKQAVFESVCGASISYSTLNEPSNINYATSGSKSIELVARDTNSGETSSLAQWVNISTDIAPDIDFTTNGFICANSSISFTTFNVSGDVATYDWSFGDANSSNQPSPTHQYVASGQYDVLLQVESTNACKNSMFKRIKIYDPPTPLFDLPSGTICTNNEFTFTNNTVDNFDGNLMYEWLVNDVQQSTSRDFKHAFSTEGDQQVKLKTFIPGCSSELTKPLLNVQTGPAVGFSFVGKCENEEIQFTNQSTGSISGFQWNLGNGNTSSFESPSVTYPTYGTYSVSLAATGTNGCISTLTKPVNIYSIPQTNFSIDLPPFACSGSLSQFNNLTPSMPDSNISIWAWSFGDQSSGASSQKNPLYTYSLAGDYSVSLTATSNFGCSSSIQKMVTIYPSPKADFSFLPACLNQGTQFSDLSTGAIKSWLWTIQSATYTAPDPIHIFKSAATHTALLTVTGTNNCISQASKNVNVPIPPVIDFSAWSTCVSKPTEFKAMDGGSSDAAVAWQWNFGDKETGAGNEVQHTYNLTDTYEVILSSTRQSGCTYSVTNSIPIVEPPKAQFNVFLNAGAAPFPVDFVNTSVGANSYNWKFGDTANTTSKEFSPSFTYVDLGDYIAELTAESVEGCVDRFSQNISVVVPAINASILDFTLTKIPGSINWTSEVIIHNKSNVALINPEVYLDISGNARISEKIFKVIKPDSSFAYTFTADIVPRDVDFACAEISVNSDEYEFDNRQCVNVTDHYISMIPYPNPAHDELIFEWINTASEPLVVIIYNSAGQAILSKQYSSTLNGLNQVKLDVSLLQAGIYFASYSAGWQVQNFKFSVVR